MHSPFIFFQLHVPSDDGVDDNDSVEDPDFIVRSFYFFVDLCLFWLLHVKITFIILYKQCIEKKCLLLTKTFLILF